MSERDWYDDYIDPIESKMSFCRDCSQSIVWLKTRRGKKIAVETADCNADDEIYNSKVHQCHWNVCPSPRGYRITKLPLAEAK
jgi:hypothetical protein